MWLPVAVIGFLDTDLTIFEGDGTFNFTIGVLQGYLDTFVTIFFVTEASSAVGTHLCSMIVLLL